MRWVLTVITAGLAELAAYFLSLTWGFMVLIGAFIWVALRLQATMATAATTATKAASTEARVNTLVPVIHTAYTTANTANSTANTANSTANSAQSDANNAQSTANTVDSRTSGLSITQSRGGGMTSAPSSYTQSWGDSVVSEVTQINNSLGNAGIFS